MGLGGLSKRILLGRKLRSSQLGETLLPKRIALPVFASDALSSVAYAPDEVFIMLSVAGASTYVWSWKIGIAVALVMLAVIASYRQTVHAYPSGGGDYEVATVNLGRTAGTTVASALLVDYVLTVAVSISSGAQYTASALPVFHDHEATLATVLVILLAFGLGFELPVAVVVLVLVGVVSPAQLREARGYVIVGIFILAAIVTPPDVVSQLLLAIPMCLLYELGIFAGGLLKRPAAA